ncbi:hypothetical protein J5N97_028286 [Dioscorea zingiberensis]|uniref:Uncharacterized protein n=1 Tax=Dioscorea zingiberensis TaxID=325984 RepID=A0A9D5BYW4_9LILI|nr:hypothetical protein J5N97_028286 [Dioscorea zingiberensis]
MHASKYAMKKPNPPNSTIEKDLCVALSEYRDLVGHLGENHKGNPVILLNGKGVRFIKASEEATLVNFMRFKPSPALRRIHLGLRDVEELVQVQLTRLTTHGLSIDSLPFHDCSIFAIRSRSQFDYEHQGMEYITKKLTNIKDNPVLKDDVIVHKGLDQPPGITPKDVFDHYDRLAHDVALIEAGLYQPPPPYQQKNAGKNTNTPKMESKRKNKKKSKVKQSWEFIFGAYALEKNFCNWCYC